MNKTELMELFQDMEQPHHLTPVKSYTREEGKKLVEEACRTGNVDDVIGVFKQYPEFVFIAAERFISEKRPHEFIELTSKNGIGADVYSVWSLILEQDEISDYTSELTTISKQKYIQDLETSRPRHLKNNGKLPSIPLSFLLLRNELLFKESLKKCQIDKNALRQIIHYIAYCNLPRYAVILVETLDFKQIQDVEPIYISARNATIETMMAYINKGFSFDFAAVAESFMPATNGSERYAIERNNRPDAKVAAVLYNKYNKPISLEQYEGLLESVIFTPPYHQDYEVPSYELLQVLIKPHKDFLLSGNHTIYLYQIHDCSYRDINKYKNTEVHDNLKKTCYFLLDNGARFTAPLYAKYIFDILDIKPYDFLLKYPQHPDRGMFAYLINYEL